MRLGSVIAIERYYKKDYKILQALDGAVPYAVVSLEDRLKIFS